MKASGSVLCSALAAAYFAAHLPFLAPSLEDIDSINFALGLREFDVAQHQPHPPGYPVFIALGRVSLAVIEAAAPGLDASHAAALALAIWSALAGALTIVAAGALYRALARLAGDDTPRARVDVLPALLLAVAPLFWLSGVRPMSDMVGLALALAAQALLVSALRTPLDLMPPTFLAALAAGVRVQTAWLTVPLLAIALAANRRRGGSLLPWRVVAAGVAGTALWLVPLVVLSGGPERYWTALGSQAGEDFAWVDMLWANPAPRRVAFALYETFVMPWGSVPLAIVVGAAAIAGVVVLVPRRPGVLAVMAAAFVPYAVFHLLFQETRHVRYALPLLPAVAWLASHGIEATRRAAPAVGAAVCAFAAWVAVPGMVAYAAEPHPAFRAIADLSDAAVRERPAAVFAHYALRRPLQAQPPANVVVVEPPRENEWLGLVDYWRRGGTEPVWFLADARRTDLAVVDPQSRTDVRAYRWLPAERLELQGARPVAVDWYRFREPGWFVTEGWSLTPELGGMTRLAGNGVDRRPVEAFVRRRPDAMVAVVGARHLGQAGDGAIVFTAALDDRVVDEWTLDPANGPNVVRFIDLAAGSLDGEGRYARFVVKARAASGTRTPASAVRQFDIQPAGGFVYAFDEGWHEAEYDNLTGLRWRWSSGRSVLRVAPPRGVRITLRGESPLRYQAEAPLVRIRAGDRTVAETRMSGDFEWMVDVPESDVRAADGRIALETDPVYLPGIAEGTVDERQLGLRLFGISVIPSGGD